MIDTSNVENPPPKPLTWAPVVWQAGDIQSLRPQWTAEQCEGFLAANEGHIQDAMVEAGWELIAYLVDQEMEDRYIAFDYGIGS